MSWLRTLHVSVPDYEVSTGNIKYTILMHNNSISPTGILSTRFRKSLKTYGQFRDLRRTLIRHSAATGGCTCHNTCPLESLQGFLVAFNFPGRNMLIRYSESAIQERRKELEGFIRILVGRMHDETASILQQCYVRNCLVLKALADFFTVSQVSKPLALNNWRRTVSNQPQLFDLDVDAKSECPNGTLPELQITPSKIVNNQVILEDIRTQLLTIHGSDLAEIETDEVDDNQLWQVALYIASRMGNTAAVQLILSHGITANACLSDGTSALNIASRMGHEQVVLLLLQTDADPNLANNVGITPLIAACRNGRSCVARHLIHAGALIQNCSHRGTHPMHAAVVSQSAEIVQLLLDYGSGVNMLTKNGTAPIHFAAKLGGVDLMQLLLEHGADLTLKTANQSTPLSIATLNKNREIIDLLISKCIVSRSKLSHSLSKDSKDMSRPSLQTQLSSVGP